MEKHNTKHGIAQFKAKVDGNDVRATVQWGHPGILGQIEYVFFPRIEGAIALIAEQTICALAAEHFDRIPSPQTCVLKFWIDASEPDGVLKLVPII